jgi:hypothetical protein
MKAAEGVN